MRHFAANAALLSVSLLAACTGADDDETSVLTCPTPSKAQTTPAIALTGRDLLRTPDFFDLMAAHGSMNDLYDVIAFRSVRGCMDVPSYNPYMINLPFGGPNLSGSLSGPSPGSVGEG